MGQDYVDPSIRIEACGSDPSEVTITLVAVRDNPSLDVESIITAGQYKILLDSATSFATFNTAATSWVPGFYSQLPEVTGDLGKSALYRCFRAARDAASAVLC